MPSRVETMTPAGSPPLIGPYDHVVVIGDFVTIGGIGGVNPDTGEIAGEDVRSQAVQILRSFETLLESVGSDLEHVLHVCRVDRRGLPAAACPIDETPFRARRDAPELKAGLDSARTPRCGGT